MSIKKNIYITEGGQIINLDYFITMNTNEDGYLLSMSNVNDIYLQEKEAIKFKKALLKTKLVINEEDYIIEELEK